MAVRSLEDGVRGRSAALLVGGCSVAQMALVQHPSLAKYPAFLESAFEINQIPAFYCAGATPKDERAAYAVSRK